MKNKLFAILAACSLLLAIPAQAQDDSTSSRRQRPIEALQSILELTDAQAQQFAELRQTHRQARETKVTQIREWTRQVRQLERQKNEMLNSASPDPGQVGSIVIQQRSLLVQVRQGRQELQEASFREAATALLTEPQKEKLAQVQQAMTLSSQAGPLAAFGLIERPRQRRGGFRSQRRSLPRAMRGSGPRRQRRGGFRPQRGQRFQEMRAPAQEGQQP